MTSREARIALGRAAVVTPSTAAAWLPFGRAAALRWLRARGLVRVVPVPEEDGSVRQVEVVTWGEVLDELEGRRIVEPTPKTRRGRLPYVDPES